MTENATRSGSRGAASETANGAHWGRTAFDPQFEGLPSLPPPRGRTYRYVRHGRTIRSAFFFASAVALAAAISVWDQNVPWVAWIGVVGLGAYGGLSFLSDASWGMILDEERLVFFDDDWSEMTPLNQIEELDVVSTSDHTVVRLVRLDRSRFVVPNRCYKTPAILKMACRDFGITVTEA